MYSNMYPSSPIYMNDSYEMDEKTRLWMGDLESWMDENFIRQTWQALGQDVVVRIIRNKQTGISCGYAFIEFLSNYAATKALYTVSGNKIPYTQSTFRLNWASGDGICEKKDNRTPEFSIFVGDLNSNVDKQYLLTLFRTRYSSCHSVKIMINSSTGISRGYGFVRFSNQQEQQQAVKEMNGALCRNRPMKVSFATPKTNQQRYNQLALKAPALIQQPTDPNNTTVFIGGLSSPVTENELRGYFDSFGEIISVKIPPGKRCGFVQYSTRISAEVAIEMMNGFPIGSSRIRLSWGRSSHQNDKPSYDPSSSFVPSSLPFRFHDMDHNDLFNPKLGPLSIEYYEYHWPS